MKSPNDNPNLQPGRNHQISWRLKRTTNARQQVLDYKPLGTPLPPVGGSHTYIFELLRSLAFDPNWSSSRIPEENTP